MFDSRRRRILESSGDWSLAPPLHGSPCAEVIIGASSHRNLPSSHPPRKRFPPTTPSSLENKLRPSWRSSSTDPLLSQQPSSKPRLRQNPPSRQRSAPFTSKLPQQRAKLSRATSSSLAKQRPQPQSRNMSSSRHSAAHTRLHQHPQVPHRTQLRSANDYFTAPESLVVPYWLSTSSSTRKEGKMAACHRSNGLT